MIFFPTDQCLGELLEQLPGPCLLHQVCFAHRVTDLLMRNKLPAGFWNGWLATNSNVFFSCINISEGVYTQQDKCCNVGHWTKWSLKLRQAKETHPAKGVPSSLQRNNTQTKKQRGPWERCAEEYCYCNCISECHSIHCLSICAHFSREWNESWKQWFSESVKNPLLLFMCTLFPSFK